MLLLVIEILIALFVHDHIVRPYVGDFFVVIMIYCFVRACFPITVQTAAISTLLFAYLIELLQYLKLVQHAGLQHSRLATTILGNQFEWIDIMAYTLGIIFVLLMERLRVANRNISYKKSNQ